MNNNKRIAIKLIGNSAWAIPTITSLSLPVHAQCSTTSAKSGSIVFSAGSSTFEVPSCVSKIQVEVSGASGGNSNLPAVNLGGLGSLVIASLTVTPGETLNVIVGQAGVDKNGFDDAATAGGAGYGKGGDGGTHNVTDGNAGVGGGGGSAIVRQSTPLVVAGAGGGGGFIFDHPGADGDSDGSSLVAGDGVPPRKGANGVGGNGGNFGSSVAANIADSGGSRDGGDGLSTMLESLFSAGSGGGGGYGGGGGGRIYLGGAGGGSLTPDGGTLTIGGAERGDGKIIISW